MKSIYVNEAWCLGCHLCDYKCAFANSGIRDMVKALKGKEIFPCIRVDGDEKITYAVSCRHCTDPICVKSCISGALHVADGVVSIDREKCVGCQTCMLVCPYGAIVTDGSGAVNKCELCTKNSVDAPACVSGCPNKAIVFEERCAK